MSLKLNTASGGSITLQEADTASNLTLTVPAQTGTVIASDASGNVNIDSNTLYVDATNDRVGIGTTTPAAKLDFGVTSLGTNVINIRKNGNYINAIGVDSNGFTRISCPNDAGIAFSQISSSDGTTFTERMRIDSSGNLLVGTTDADPSGSGVKGIAARADGLFEASCNGSYAADFGRNTSNGQLIRFRRSGTVVGAIDVTTTNTSYLTSSDYRLKENISPMTGALATVSALKPCTYTWKTDGSGGQGFIAHDLQAVVPDCVSGEKDAVEEE